MVERVIWRNEKRKTFLHECMIRFQLESFSLVEFTRKAAKDEKLREGKTLLYDKLPCFSRVESSQNSQVSRKSTSNKSATLNCLINVFFLRKNVCGRRGKLLYMTINKS